MHTLMHPALAEARGLDLLATAANARAAGAATRRRDIPASVLDASGVLGGDDVAIRLARPSDARALARLAALDDQVEHSERLAQLASEPWEGSVLVAESDGSVAAALAVEDGIVVADPFRRTALLVDLLRLRAEQLTGAAGRFGGLPRVSAVLHPRLR